MPICHTTIRYLILLPFIKQINMVTQFKLYLAKTNLAENTIASYVWTVTYFLEHYKEVNKKNLLAYKGYLVENFKPQTVNLRLQVVNRFLEFNKQEKLKMKFVKAQQKNFLENVISDANYKFLKAKLKTDGYDQWYFIVWFMAATGARVSELLQIKAEHVSVGYLDLYSKGGKMRRIYIPKRLSKSTPYTLYNILYLIYTKGYKVPPFQTYKGVCLVP